MTLRESDLRTRMARLVAETEHARDLRQVDVEYAEHQRFLRRRHAVRVAVTVACFAVLLWGCLSYAFSG
jgi:hypothetical protein